MSTGKLTARCCIAGGGPAGMMLGLLLARAGIDVLVLEKHADFLRDFRGDTIHPSTMEIMHELGMLDAFLRLPHQPVARLAARFGDTAITMVDFAHLPTRAKFIAMMPQWDFLNFLAEQARRYPSFRLMMETEAQALIETDQRVVGLRAAGAEGPLEIRADLVVAADGRGSTLRAASGLAIEELGAPIDALWFRLSRAPDDTADTQARFDAGRLFVMLNRGDYWQCAYVIAKGANARLRAAGLDAFRHSVGALLPFAASRAAELTDWEQVKLLVVQVNRLKRWWRPGLLCIGDAAHAMSPVGGVGVNLAVQDAVATANLLTEALRLGSPAPDDLARVQDRRDWPTRITQRMQLLVQDRIIAPTLAKTGTLKVPLALRLLTQVPGFSRLPARLIGLGVRPEHVQVPAA